MLFFRDMVSRMPDWMKLLLLVGVFNAQKPIPHDAFPYAKCDLVERLFLIEKRDVFIGICSSAISIVPRKF